MTVRLYRNFSTQDEIDKEYNPSTSVSNADHYIQWYVDESAAVRRELACELDLQFGPTLDETVDIFPARVASAPLLVFIHGGYWRRFSSKEFSLVARGLVAHGIAVAVTNYSLCPKASVSEITRQSRAAITWLYRHAGSFGADPERIFVAGHSAGGHQVGMVVSTDWPGNYGLPADTVKGGIPISGLFDLRPLRYSYIQPTVMLDHESIERQSPHFIIPDVAPPLLVSVGGDESSEFLRQSSDYLAAWRAKGLAGELFVQRGKHHFDVIDGFTDADSLLCKTVVDFIAGA